ncbi:hypothetical protein [Enterobacter bugandensis]|uniref:hypothetical protein n=1 Tax=Enterobacter bugandensis TaxID=881260 RepID=UPI002FCFD5BC
MSKYIVVDRDMLFFDPMFGHRTVNVIEPRIIRGSGMASVNNKKICVLGDERQVRLKAIYTIPGYSPGQGIVTITLLNADQQVMWCWSKKPVILVGSKFLALFTPTSPAIMTSPPATPDPSAPTPGSGKFINSQFFVTAS